MGMPRPPRVHTSVPLPRNAPERRHPTTGVLLSDDRHHNQPVNWNNRHRLILYMDCAGQRVKHIAESLHYNPQRVRAIMSSPLYKQQKDELLEELKDRTLTDLLDMIRADAPKNFKALVELRETAEPKIRVAAARAIQHDQDRVYPRKTEKVEERTVKIQIDQSTIGRIAQTMLELGGHDAIETEALVHDIEHVPAEGRPLLAPRAVDDLVRELTNAERTEAATAER